MIQSNFKYTDELLNKISKNSTKNIKTFIMIAIFAMLTGVVILMLTGNKTLGIIFACVLVVLIVSLILTNKSMLKANQSLFNQDVNITFAQDKMILKSTLGKEILYNISFDYKAIKKVVKKSDLIYVYFNRSSAIVIPKSSFTTDEDYEKALHLVSDNYTV